MQSGRPIAFLSKSLGPKADGQSVYEKEAIAILEAIKKWRHYILGGKLVIRTDQQSLKFMMNQRLVEGIQHKLMLKLMEYDYSVEYKQGKQNYVADALSRMPIIQEKEEESCQAITIVVPEGRIYVGQGTNIRTELLRACHASSFGGHSSMRATYHRIKLLFYWPRLKKEVENFVRECPTCQVTKGENVHIPGLLEPLEIPDMAWSHITMDFIEGLPMSRGKDVIFVVVDRLTKYAHFLALSHPYAVEQVVEDFMDNIHKLHGMPNAIITDRDRIFTSGLFHKIFKAKKVQLRFSTAYHSQTDGQTERVNQCLESYLRNMTFQETKNCSPWLALAEWWYNTTYHTAIQMTPFKA